MLAQPARPFSQTLAEYIPRVREAAHHDARRLRFLAWVQEAFGIDLNAVQVEEKVYRGLVDAILGNLVFEFKSDLPRELEDARGQLSRYISQLKEDSPNAVYTAVVTDGLRFHVYAPVYTSDGVTVADLVPLGDVDLGQPSLDTDALFLWFDSLLSHYRQERRPATAQSVVAGLGPASASFQAARVALTDLLRQSRSGPVVQVRFQEWQRYLALVYGETVGDDDLFIKHTYLATVARLVAFFHLQPDAPLSSDPELEDVIRGTYFRDRAGLPNFIEEDFFTWFLDKGVREEGLALVRRLMDTLGTLDFSGVTEDVLKGLYQELVDPQARHDLGEYYTPDWLAERILTEDLALPEDPCRSLLDPACGSGTFLFIAIRIIKEALAQRGETSDAILTHVLDNVVGVDVHPLAVIIARTNYLMALGELLRGPRGEVSIPVYLADSLRLPEVEKAIAGSAVEGSYTIPTQEPRLALQIPESLALSPHGLDHALFRMGGQYLSALRAARSQEATDKAFEGFRNYLVSLETPRKPFVLEPEAAGVLLETFRILADLDRQGKDTLYFFILRNALRPTILSRRGFDLVVGNPPWLSLRYIRHARYARWVKAQVVGEYGLLNSRQTHLFTQMELATLFFARAADLYLRDGGTIAFVMPRSVMVAQQHERFTSFFLKGGSLVLDLKRLLDLEGVAPLFNVPACVLVAEKGRETHYPVEALAFRGDLGAKNLPWASAQEQLEVRPVALDRVGGRLLPQGAAIQDGTLTQIPLDTLTATDYHQGSQSGSQSRG
jgi:methylase of polypeptide subunit release factors